MKQKLINLDALHQESKEKMKHLTKEEIKYFKNHLYFKDLNLTNEEINTNILIIKKIIKDNETCLINEKKCYAESNYHIGLKRNNLEFLEAYAYFCPKIQDIKNKYSFKDNYIYNYYENADISNVLLSKEHFTSVDISFQNIVDEYKKIRDNHSWQGMYIYGGFGVGKTHLSYAIANDLSTKWNAKVCFVFLPEYINMIKKSFNDENMKIHIDNLTDSFKEVDILIIDDIGAEHTSEWFYIEYFLNILNQRMNNKKITFFNSNLSLSELEKSFNIKFKEIDSKKSVSRLMDRIKALVNNKEYNIKGKSHRY